jgi:nucleotide-binding universal stress UspA family protein
MYDNVLVPVDGSATAYRGLTEAIKIARKAGSRLILLHVVNEFVLDYTYSSGAFTTDLLDSIRQQGKTILEEASRRARAEGLHPESVLIETIGGSAAALIVQKAAELKADLIVLGTHGRRGLRRLALGSDAEEVVRLSNIPVLLVRGAEGDSARNAGRPAS